METRSIQTWPGGTGFQYQGEWQAKDHKLRVSTYNGDKPNTWRKGTAEEWRQIRIAQLAEIYAERDILTCQSTLVDDLLKHSAEGERGDLSEGFSYDEITNSRTDASEWGIEKCRDFLSERGITMPDNDPWDMDRETAIELLTGASIEVNDDDTIETLREAIVSNIDDETIDGIEDWREAVNDNAEDAEIFEWWLVSSWLCRELTAIGECTLDNGYGHWWGRTCTGQGLIMDGTLQAIAAKYVD